MLSWRLAAVTLGLVSAATAACSLIYSTDGLSGHVAADASPSVDSEGGGDSGLPEASPSADAASDALADADATDDLGLIGEWHFDETSGYTVKDTSGYGRHAVLAGGVGFVSDGGTLGGAVEFDGGGSVKVVALDGSAFPRSGTLSIHFLRNNGPFAYGRNIFDEYNTNKPPHLFLRDVNNGDTQVVFQSWDAGYTFVVPFSDPGNLWRHVIIVWDEAKGTGAVWVDGALLKNNATAVPFAPTGEEFVLGRYFIGRIDELRLYNRPLTATEIATIP